MTETDQKLEDAVLKRMLETPPTPHKERAAADGKAKKDRPDNRRR
jgi:hypothetical protein